MTKAIPELNIGGAQRVNLLTLFKIFPMFAAAFDGALRHASEGIYEFFP